ncbi:hypothetical protein CC78DRAFT_567769 [Lojkania enalia]|uniref:Protein kinase domain-containing protein n=1 Tax=Lojkania enalia TaxID=147567 RepID=A0A9P4N8K0_9PLEO|nr:hypothetical protein CC78DRAFT_567769 [Didymosphaeria enalia]
MSQPHTKRRDGLREENWSRGSFGTPRDLPLSVGQLDSETGTETEARGFRSSRPKTYAVEDTDRGRYHPRQFQTGSNSEDVTSSDDSGVGKDTSLESSLIQTSPQSSASSDGPYFTPSQSIPYLDVNAERQLEISYELQSIGAELNNAVPNSEEWSNNIDLDVERPYTSRLGVPDYLERRHPSESVISDAGDQEHKRQKRINSDEKKSVPEDKPGHERLSPIQIQTSPHELQTELFKALVDTRPDVYGPVQKFLPKAHLDRLVNKDAIYRELEKDLSYAHTSKQIENIAEEVYEETVVLHAGKQKVKSFRQIFALLAFAEMTHCINMFLEEDLSDLDLPLVECKNDEGIIELRRRNSSNNPSDQSLNCFKNWTLMKLFIFETYQWYMRAPYFFQGEDGEIKHFPLGDKTILPFLKTELTDDEDPEYRGGFGKVFFVRIHEEHYNFRDPKSSKHGFAIKQLYEKNPEAFNRETTILKKFSGPASHPHVVSLLATYEHLNKYHLMFYRAEGDLFKFWKHIMPSPELNHAAVIWMAQQCAGIADGLLRLHRHLTITMISHMDTGEIPKRQSSGGKHVKIVQSSAPIQQRFSRQLDDPTSRPGSPALHGSSRVNSVELANQPSISDRKKTQRFGRHGDINPRNILWYDNLEENTKNLKGILKLSDFGQAELNSRLSRSRQRDVANTMTYRAPECDIEPKIINQSYDIWCLGCVYLEFIAWMLGGADLLEEFATRRVALDIFLNQKIDTFFLAEKKIESNPSEAEVMVKPVVTEFISELHRHPNCTEYYHNFLNMIQQDMLLIEPGNRKTCESTRKTLQNWAQKCLQDDAYAAKRCPWPDSPFKPHVESVKVNVTTAIEQEIASKPILAERLRIGAGAFQRKAMVDSGSVM